MSEAEKKTSDDKLWEASVVLADEEKQLLQLRMEGRTFKEIAQIMGGTKQWANIQYHKILNQIREAHKES
jgi:DNA-directed RNA polymerase specialized sigma subunit